MSYSSKHTGAQVEALLDKVGDTYTKTEADAAITAKINALDVASKGGAGKYIQAISQTDGKVSATEATMPTALKNPTAITIQKNGASVGSYDGSEAKTINISDVASAATLSSHTGNTTAHITAAERTKWNKVVTDLAAILGTDSDTIINKWEEVVAFLDTYTEADTLANLLGNKVDKISGKGLSTNDFTTALLNKLNGIEAGANKYVLAVATASVLGGIKLGYASSGKNYKVQVDASGNAYVNVPWSDTVYTLTKAAVEAVLTGNITSHTHSQYLTAHQPIYALTIQRGGTAVGTYTPNSAAKTINITLPTFSEIQSKPTTLSGYGITNAYTKDEVNSMIPDAGVPIVNHGTSAGSFTIYPNTFHVWGKISTLTLTLGGGSSSKMDEYMVQFSSQTTLGTSLSLPSDIQWMGGSAPQIEAGKTYQLSIINGLAVIGEF